MTMMISSCILVAIIQQIQWVLAYENYPNTDKIQRCAPKNSTIYIKAPICIPNGGRDGWEPESAANCAGILKDQCPEFNQAECVWQPLSFNQTNVGYDCASNIFFPACRLKYYASLHESLSKKTWMEIMYVNQYGTTLQNNTDYYIIEVHRWVRDGAMDYFVDVSEADYPLSAPNSKQPGGGLKWNSESFYLYQSAITVKPLCPGGKDVDNYCIEIIHDAYVNLAFSINFDYIANPNDVVCICSSEVRFDDNNNKLIKEDVCRIERKSSNQSYSKNICNARKGKSDEKNTTKIELKCRY